MTSKSPLRTSHSATNRTPLERIRGAREITRLGGVIAHLRQTVDSAEEFFELSVAGSGRILRDFCISVGLVMDCLII